MLTAQNSYRDYLRAELVRRIRTNPRYSQRAFARHLTMSPGELSEVLCGKRSLSVRSALKVAKTLGLTPEETQRLLFLIQIEKVGAEDSPALEAVRDSAPTPQTRNLTLDVYHIISDWYCLAILTLADCMQFSWDPAWIAKRFGISVHEVTVALERLERVGLIERSAGGALSVVKDYVLSPAGVPSEAIRNTHRQLLEKAIASLDLHSVDQREFCGVGLAFDPRQLPSVRAEVNEFLDHLVRKYSRGKRSQVYHLQFCSFPLTEGDPHAAGAKK